MKAVRPKRVVRKETKMKETKPSTKIIAGILAGLMIFSAMTTAILMIVEIFSK